MTIETLIFCWLERKIPDLHQLSYFRKLLKMTNLSKSTELSNVTLALGDGQPVCKHFQTGFFKFVARDICKKLAKQRTAKRPVPLDTQNLANILPWTSSASLAKLAAISTVLTLLIAISVSKSEFCRPQLLHCQNLWRLLRNRLWSWKIQTNVTCVIILHLPALD